MILTEQEINKIFSWQPYRDDWVVDRNQINNKFNFYYGGFVNILTKNQNFDTYYSESGGLGNYLEFICYPPHQVTYDGNAIVLCISLCAPIAAYGQTSFTKRVGFNGWDGLFSADKTGDISDFTLLTIEKEIKAVLLNHNLTILEKDFVSKQLPNEIVEALIDENHNIGSQYLHGLFQKID